MNYHDVYFNRINHLGETTAEKIKNGGLRSFERWMAESPFTVLDLSVERGLYFDGIIQTNKDREEKKIMFLYLPMDIPVKVGDILNWQQEDGSISKWLLIQKEQKVNGYYQTFWIIRCNYLIHWIDADGRLQKSWAYVVSSTDDKIKGNFRTWHNLITPQPNKYAEIIMPRQVVDRGTNFIIEDEGWKMVEADFTSVEGIIYMSLTESKVNYQYDDRVVDVADTDRLKFPELAPMYTVGESLVPAFNPDFTFNEWEIELIPTVGLDEVVAFRDGVLTAINEGTATIIMQLKDRPAVQKRFELIVRQAEEEFSAYIDGADSIKLDRQAEYTFIGTTALDDAVTFRFEPTTELATLREGSSADKVVVRANKKNKLGEVILVATYKGVDYFKTIKIVPLW